MAPIIQIIVTLIYAVLAEGYHRDPFILQFDSDHFNFPTRSDDRHRTSNSGNQRPVSGDIFSYKFKDDNYYRDGFNNAYDPYFAFPGFFKRQNYDEMPITANVPNKLNYPGPVQTPQVVSEVNDKSQVTKLGTNHEIPSSESSDSKKNKSENSVTLPASVNDDNKIPTATEGQKAEELNDKSKQFITNKEPEDTPPKTNEVKYSDSSEDEAKNKVALNAKKDYLLVDNNGNGAYLLHENNPNGFVPINNQPARNNVVYVTPNKNVVQPVSNPIYQYVNGQPSFSANIPTSVVSKNNQPNNNIVYVPVSQNTNYRQPGNQVFQLVNGQLMSVNVPLTHTANRVDPSAYNNVLLNPVQGNTPSNNYNPSYILIYANGQLTQIPGIIINPQQNVQPVQNGYNSVPVTSVPNNNIPNGYSPMILQVPNTNIPATSNSPQSNIVLQNPQPNTNLGTYNAPNGYVQTGVLSNYNPAVAVNNPGVQTPVAQPVNNNGYVFQQPPPSPQKESNIVLPPQNNISTTYGQPITSHVVREPSAAGNNYIMVQPAVMFSGFKERDHDKDESKETDEKDHKKDMNIKKDKEPLE